MRRDAADALPNARPLYLPPALDNLEAHSATQSSHSRDRPAAVRRGTNMAITLYKREGVREVIGSRSQNAAGWCLMSSVSHDECFWAEFGTVRKRR
jgi:hypothetical protein